MPLYVIGEFKSKGMGKMSYREFESLAEVQAYILSLIEKGIPFHFDILEDSGE